MQAVFSCVTESHDLILVALAAFICALGIFAAFGLAREAARAEGGGRIKALWSLGAAASLASAIWATHFIAMLAYQPGMAVSFEIPLTALSYVVAIAPVGAGGAVLAVARGTAARLSGGAILGLAISAMHYTGMAAYRVQGVIEWDHGMVAMSTVLGVLFSVAAVLVAYRPGRLAAAAAPTLMVLAVCATHFVGMTAAVPRFDPAVAPPADFGNVTTLVTLVANVALVIVAFSLAAVWVSFRDRLKLAAEEKRLRDLADIAVEGLLICDGERIVGANSSIESLAGCARADLVGRALEDVVSGLKVRDVSMQHEAEARIDAAGGGIPVRVIAQEISLGGRKHVVVAVRDQRERLRTEAEMVRLAYQDALTGLANRASFAKHHDELEASRVETRAYALFTVDLDRFKEVNDTLGHAVGDELLRRVAGRLKSAVRGVDAVARLGGDEFSALAPGVSDPRSASAIAERIIDLCARPYSSTARSSKFRRASASPFRRPTATARRRSPAPPISRSTTPSRGAATASACSRPR
ncbi:MHYT domain-containing protein [Chenggangzhangella methanolivorans]|uniref:MHYT domain-containing protein n=1 Tax=Chenggangzhangella methanolivorans TaxID=1437009 RepID=UPI0021BD0A4D|nr:MHYT domain-containing protein [Chenggangzhangella methanolivorans]